MAKYKGNNPEINSEVESKGKQDCGSKGAGSAKEKKDQIKKGQRRRRNRSRNNADFSDSNGSNDFSWYNTLPELTQAAANFSFANPLGTRLNLTAQGSVDVLDLWNETSRGPYNRTIPGFMFIHWNPTIGCSLDGNSPVNVTARNIYSFVRHANSGASNYDATDLMIYLLALDSVYSCYNAAARAYGYLNLYSPVNRYMPRYLVEGLGFDFDDLLANQAQFMFAINNICFKISSFAVPNFMSYYLKHMWMNSNAYRDKPNLKAQVYAFVQDTFFQYQTNYNSTNYAGLKRISAPWHHSACTVSEWVSFMEDLINPLLASEDMGIMSGDILKAFGMQNLFNVMPITQEYAIDPIYNPEVLIQIQNLSIMGNIMEGLEETAYGTFTGDIYQPVNEDTAEGYLYSNPGFIPKNQAPLVGEESLCTVDRLVTSDEEIPSKEFVVVSTRLTNKADGVTQTKSGTKFAYMTPDHTVSTEVVSGVEIIAADFTAGYDIAGIVFQGSGNTGEPSGEAAIQSAASALNALSKFDWCPTLGITYYANDTVHFMGYYQDTTNYSIMTAEDLNKLHSACLMSEFYVPQIGSATRKPQ